MHKDLLTSALCAKRTNFKRGKVQSRVAVKKRQPSTLKGINYVISAEPDSFD